MAKKASASVQRVREALTAAGVETEVQELSSSTRTALEAAEAVGCEVAQIVKSLILKGEGSGNLYLVLTSGRNRLCVEYVAELAGEPVAMADAVSVRERTGFAVGGVPPLAHREALTAIVDEDLLAHDKIWAAAGSPSALFMLTPDELLRITGGRPARVATSV